MVENREVACPPQMEAVVPQRKEMEGISVCDDVKKKGT